MDFFEHQDRARRTSHWLILFFLLGVTALAGVVAVVALLFLGEPPPAGPDAGPMAWVSANLDILLITAALVVGGILLASLFRIASLASGGSHVAEMLGGTRVTPDSGDPLKRRLLNVVEEIALASGTPMPDVYLLEEEDGINAFAAGYGTGDAAIAVTRGTLEKLDRAELKGVVAHEFSHVLNGDMRLNIRLMGILFGLLVLTIVGRFMVRALYFGGRGRDSQQVAMAVAAMGAALLVIGALGVFFGRLIKAAVSRQREFLADASAVQFTRNPEGIGGALKKIALHSQGSKLESPETEEVSHMLIASGFTSMSGLLATHPPLTERIRAIEPNFDPERDLEELARREQQRDEREERRRAADEERRTRSEAAAGSGGIHIPGFGQLPGTDGLPEGALLGAILADVDSPDEARQQQARHLLDSLPEPLREAGHGEDAHLVVAFTVLGSDAEVREKQLAIARRAWGRTALETLESWIAAGFEPTPSQRLPLLEMVLPALRHRPAQRLRALRETLGELVAADGRISPFEFALGQLFDAHMRDILKPSEQGRGRARLDREMVAGIRVLLSVMARAGSEDDDTVAAAYAGGMARLYRDTTPPPFDMPVDWAAALGAALPRLDRLGPENKKRLLDAMLATISHNGRVNVAEAELLRAFAAALHVPVPLVVPTAE